MITHNSNHRNTLKFSNSAQLLNEVPYDNLGVTKNIPFVQDINYFYAVAREIIYKNYGYP